MQILGPLRIQQEMSTDTSIAFYIWMYLFLCLEAFYVCLCEDDVQCVATSIWAFSSFLKFVKLLSPTHPIWLHHQSSHPSCWHRHTVEKMLKHLSFHTMYDLFNVWVYNTLSIFSQRLEHNPSDERVWVPYQWCSAQQCLFNSLFWMRFTLSSLNLISCRSSFEIFDDGNLPPVSVVWAEAV